MGRPSALMLAELANQVRLHVLRTAMDAALVPSALQTAGVLDITEAQAVEAYRRLAERHVYVLEAGDPTRLRMANPFSAVPTPFEVEVAGKRYYGNCVWDALGVVSLLGGNGAVKTSCPDCEAPMSLVVADRHLVRKEGVVHFSVPAPHWWDDIVYT